jgi:hypothetical protein
MPTLFRLIVVAGALTALVMGGLYILATKYEPVSKEVIRVVPGVKIRK